MALRWTNGTGNVAARPSELAEPRSVEQVVDTVGRARSERRAVRVIGAGAAWSPLATTDGCLLSLKRLRSIRQVDTQARRITVEAGADLLEVVETAAQHGMSVMSPSMYLGLSVGGLIATGSHGTGRRSATVGDAAVAMELVTAAGEVRRLDPSHGELWRAAITSVGTLGVVTAVTLQCEPLYNVLESHLEVPVGEVPSVLPTVLREHEFVSLFWYPSARTALFKLGNRTELPAGPVNGGVRPNPVQRSTKWIGPLMAPLAARVPALAEPVWALMRFFLGTPGKVLPEPQFAHYQQVYPPVISAEHGIPVEHASEAWQWLSTRLQAYWQCGLRPIDMVVHARFTGPSRALLASAADRATCHLEVLSHAGNRQRPLFLPEFDEKMRSAFDGRPHWGKELVDPSRIAACHGNNVDRFLEVRQDLDPEQRFMNPLLRDQVFGLARRRRVTESMA